VKPSSGASHEFRIDHIAAFKDEPFALIKADDCIDRPLSTFTGPALLHLIANPEGFFRCYRSSFLQVFQGLYPPQLIPRLETT
jgi:hypothetical protein